MTVIAAAVTEHGVTIAADAQTTAGWKREYHEQPKLWVAEKLALGAAGCKRTTQVLQHQVSWPRYRPDEDTDWEAWLVKVVIPAIRTGVKDHGIVKNDSGIETIDAEMLLATSPDRISVIASNGCVVTENCGRSAIGSGAAEALGRLGDKGPWTETDVVDAVRRAIITDLGCSGPINVLDTATLQIRTVK